MDFENINQKIGGCGLYQYICFFLLSITTYKNSVDFQSLTFTVYEPKFKCMPTENVTADKGIVNEDQCKYRISPNSSWQMCTKWVYERNVLTDSFVMEFNMVCGRSHYRELMFSSFYFGNLASYPFIMLTDYTGKKPTLMISIAASILITIWQVLVHTLWQQVMLLFLSGVTKVMITSLAFTTLVEVMPSNILDLAATNFWVFYSIGYMASALFAYYGRNWRIISLLSLLLTVFYFLYFCFVPETPRWLMLNGKRENSFKIMSFIAKINSRKLDRKDFDNWKPIQQKTGKFWNLFKHKTMICRLLILNFAAWSFNFAYIASATDLTFASNNIFITTFVMGFIELPTGPLAGLLANKLGRKKAVISLCSLGVLCLLILPFIEADLTKSTWQPWLKICLAMGGKLGFASAWLVFDIITSETIPTSDRNSAMSIVYLAVGIGSIVAPMIHSIATGWYYAAPCLIYSISLVITIVLVILFIPETHNLPIPQTIEQAVSLVIHKENEWKANMILQSKELGVIETVKNME